MSLQRQHPGDENWYPRVDDAPHGVEAPTTLGGKTSLEGNNSSSSCCVTFLVYFLTHWVIADWLGLMEPARGESCLSGQRRGPAAPGEDKFPSPGQKSFHISTNSTTQGRKR